MRPNRQTYAKPRRRRNATWLLDTRTSHGPIPSLKWGPMTMEFKPPKAGLPPGIQAGADVSFDFVQTPEGEFEITAMRKGR